MRNKNVFCSEPPENQTERATIEMALSKNVPEKKWGTPMEKAEKEQSNISSA